MNIFLLDNPCSQQITYLRITIFSKHMYLYQCWFVNCMENCIVQPPLLNQNCHFSFQTQLHFLYWITKLLLSKNPLLFRSYLPNILTTFIAKLFVSLSTKTNTRTLCSLLFFTLISIKCGVNYKINSSNRKFVWRPRIDVSLLEILTFMTWNQPVICASNSINRRIVM